MKIIVIKYKIEMILFLIYSIFQNIKILSLKKFYKKNIGKINNYGKKYQLLKNLININSTVYIVNLFFISI